MYMYLYELPDLKDEINRIIKDDTFSQHKLKTMLLDFFNRLDNDFRTKIINLISEECYEIIPNSNITPNNFIDVISEIFDDASKQNLAISIANTIADCSDSEELCEHKIYIVIKNLYDDSDRDMVKEYDSWEEAEKDIDEWYTSCCDDLFIAENMMFPILCSVQSREFDFTSNFCTVIEFDATGLEECRESWEDENCDYDCD